MRAATFTTTIALALVVIAPEARGQGAVIGPDALARADRAALTAGIEAARRDVPQAFEALAGMRAKLRDLDANKRGRLAPTTPRLAALGPDALFPMLEAIAVRSPDDAGLPETARIAWRAGLLEAVGRLKDPRAAAVLHAVLADPEVTEHYTVRAAVQALGGLCDDSALARLTTLVATPGPKQASAQAAAGYCRRTAMVERLSALLASAGDDDAARRLAGALADAGNAWAWRLQPIERAAEGADVRAKAARALLAAVRGSDGGVREAATKALLVVAWPETQAWVSEATKDATGDERAALERLLRRLESNPVSRRR